APGVLRLDAGAAPTPPVFAERTAAWDGAYPERPDLAVRVEAASFRGRPVYFRISHPEWGEPPRDRPVPIVDSGRAFLAIFDALRGVFMAAVTLFAVRNVRRGRADLRGAAVLAVAMAILQLLYWLLAGGHFPDVGIALPLFVNEFVMVLFACGLTAVSYL